VTPPRPASRPLSAPLGRTACVAALAGILLLFLVPLQRWFAHTGGRWLYLLRFSFFLSFLLVRPVRTLAWRLSALDHPDARKLHGRPTPLLGGLAVYLAFVVSLLANSILTAAVGGLLVAATAGLAVSAVDDVRPLPAAWKLLGMPVDTARSFVLLTRRGGTAAGGIDNRYQVRGDSTTTGASVSGLTFTRISLDSLLRVCYSLLLPEAGGLSVSRPAPGHTTRPRLTTVCAWLTPKRYGRWG
jgi:hypothetical protein